MSIRQEYFDLLAHVGNTSTIATLSGSSVGEQIIAMRHDVDHDLELALELAHYEWRLGCKSTYYLLHTEAYWNDPKFPLLVRQLKEYGHEIGLHVNFLTQWMRGEIDDVELEIERALAHVRACNVDVTGVCAHGDKLCYENGFVNYWLWNELRGDNPMESEDGISAEGISVDNPNYQIPYPPNHELVREDGAKFPLWSISMEKHGLTYDAAKLQQEHYWSDSGGSWVRSGDPMEGDFSQGRHQVLVHPWWWRGEPKKIFVMSPARSGSKWLANYIDKATSAVGLHEWTLNHVRDGDEFPLDNRTTREFVSLLGDASEITSRLRAARAHHTLLKQDVVECNVYVEAVAEMVQAIIPDAEIVHLKREPTDIVRSILNRGWYEVTQDHKHRSDGSKKWNSSNQLERACRYVRSANENIAAITDNEITFNKMVSDADYLPEELFKLGIVVHPLLARELFNETVNKNKNEPIPSFDEWNEEDQEFTKNILFGDMSMHKEIKFKSFKKVRTPNWKKTNAKNMHFTRSLKSVSFSAIDPEKPAYIVFFGASWDTSNGMGIPSKPNREYKIYLKTHETSVRVFAVQYDDDGGLLEKIELAPSHFNKVESDILLQPATRFFSVALLLENQKSTQKQTVLKMDIFARKLTPNYSTIADL
ncbi:MAG TPA: hypothetical protein EYN32_00625 [Phycisphaerales bacterium]|nr:hypothetical protein [Phycisphaerales bacterium]